MIPGDTLIRTLIGPPASYARSTLLKRQNRKKGQGPRAHHMRQVDGLCEHSRKMETGWEVLMKA